MTNPYYNHGTTPGTGSGGSSALMRAEFDAVTAGFALLAPLTTAGAFVQVNGAGNAQQLSPTMTEAAGVVSIAGALHVTGNVQLTNAGSSLLLARTSDGVQAGTLGSRSGAAFSLYNGGGTTAEVKVDAGNILLQTGGANGLAIAANGNVTINGAQLICAGSQNTFSDGTYTGFIGRGSAIVSGGAAGDFAMVCNTGNFVWAFSGGGAKMTLSSAGALAIAAGLSAVGVAVGGALTGATTGSFSSNVAVGGTFGAATISSSAGIAVGGGLTGATTGAFSGLITASAGLTFDGTNTLSNYAPGTLSLGLAGSTSGVPTGVSGLQKYTRIGNVVFVQIDLIWTAQGSALGNLVVSGTLPFPGVGSLQTMSCLVTGSSTGPNSAYVTNGSSTLNIAASGATQSAITWTQLGAGGGGLQVFGSYFV